MELEQFTKKIISDIVRAVDGVSDELQREVSLRDTKDTRTIEFDIAITTEKTDGVGGEAGIKVIEFIQGKGEISKEVKNSTVSRVKFGVNVNFWTKKEEALQKIKNEEITHENLDPYD